MTERLAALLRDEATEINAPAPAAGEILARGRRERTQRRAVAAGTGLGAVAAATAVVLALQGVGDDRSSAPDPAGGIGDAPFYAVGATVYVPDGPAGGEVAIDDKAIKSMYAVDSGIVVRHGDNSYSDGGGPQRFSLIGDDGVARRLGLVTEETVHASDPAQDLIVYGENVDDTLFLVLYDAVADTEALRVDLGPSQEGWFPVALDGDIAYLQDGYGGTIHAVDITTGSPADAGAVKDVWEVAGGHTLAAGQDAGVIDAATGDVLLDLPDGGSPDLSPDGRFVQVTGGTGGGMGGGEGRGPQTEVYDVATGTSVSVTGGAWGLTWTGGHDLFAVDTDGTLTTCSAETGACTTSTVTVPAAPPEQCHTETTGEGRDQVIESWCEGGSVDIIAGTQTRES